MRRSPLLLLFVLSAGCTSTNVHERTEERVVPAPPAAVRVDVQNGSVSLTVTRSLEATVRAVWSTLDSDRTAADVRLMQSTLGIDTDSGTLEIKPEAPEGVSVSLMITVPDTSGVIISTVNGSVDVNGASGAALLLVGNGSIRCVDQDGTVSAKTDLGSIQVLNATDAVEVITRDGNIEITGASAYVRAKTNRGNIDLTARPDSSPPLFCQSDLGSVTATVGPAFVGEVTLGAPGGRTSVEDPDGRLRVNAADGDTRYLVLGDSTETSSLSSMDGSVRFILESADASDEPSE